MESYTQPNNDAVDFSLESYNQPNNDAVDFSSEPTPTDTPTETPDRGPGIDVGPIDFPESIDLPTGPLQLSRMNTGVAIFLATIIAGTLYASLKLRSLFGIFGWLLLLVALLASVLTNLPLLYFWLAVIVEGFLLVLSSLAYTRQQAQ